MDTPIEGAALRRVMRHVPSPVTVVTAAEGRQRRGITIGSFTSVALDPPLVSFNVAHDASIYDLIVQVPHFAVHVLAEEQAHLAEHFAIPDLTSAEQFEAVSHRIGRHGLPLLDDVAAVLYCTPHDTVMAGDKTILFGLVTDAELLRPEAGSVLYYKRSYRGIGTELTSTVLSPVNRASSDTS